MILSQLFNSSGFVLTAPNRTYIGTVTESCPVHVGGGVLHMKRYWMLLLAVLPLLVIALPAVLVDHSVKEEPPTGQVASPATGPAYPDNQPVVKVYRTEANKIDTVPLEAYVEGVVAAEMPAEFELEALKAQALAARTYIVKRLQEGRFDDVPAGAHVVDSVKHQAYLDDAQRRERWGAQYEWKTRRIQQAVADTAGKVLTYEGKPIDATFFSTSNGFTENANEYWERPVPYLRSVPSPWDIESPRFEERKVLSVGELEQKLGVKISAAAASNGSWYQVLDRTTGNRIGKVRVGEKEFSGREIREKLGLNSSAFTMHVESNRVIITTRGYGHGVGMSQWGANGMAKSGKKAEQIVKYFYQGVTLQDYREILMS